MLKKIIAILALAAAPFVASQADNSMPNVLAGLNSNIQVMDDNKLSEVRGTGNLPDYFAFREYYYNWNNYGAKSDFRSYLYDGESTFTGGIDSGAGAWTGEQWLVSISGTQYVAEQRAWYLEQDSQGVVSKLGETSWSDLTAYNAWDGNFHLYQDYSIVY